METSIKIEELYAFKKATYYSIRIENDELTELEKFIKCFENKEDYEDDFEDLFAWIKLIGEEEGANPVLFRHEASAQALPPGYKTIRSRNRLKEIGYRLRLYCIRINANVIILLNGGVKRTQKVQEDSELLAKFRFANKVSEAITEKMINKELWVEGHSLKGNLELFI